MPEASPSFVEHASREIVEELMSSGEPDSKASNEIPSDEEWQAQVRAENAALDAARKAETVSPSETAKPTPEPQAAGAGSSGERGRTSIPPADFPTLVTMLSTQAMVGLGFIPHPATGKPTPNLDLARHFIDLLGVIEKKTMGNLESNEHTFLDSTLHDLRMAFVQMLNRGTPPAE